MTVRRVVEAVAVYPNWDDLRSEYPELEREDIRQALEFAAKNLDDQILPLEAA
ncbi:MAG: antitoxin [Deltaproteobacteria bacterium RBG_13_47_9]|nr:MAG: antitoxin [Deltaproteobacteria bacterium RBG_13_47_9]